MHCLYCKISLTLVFYCSWEQCFYNMKLFISILNYRMHNILVELFS